MNVWSWQQSTSEMPGCFVSLYVVIPAMFSIVMEDGTRFVIDQKYKFCVKLILVKGKGRMWAVKLLLSFEIYNILMEQRNLQIVVLPRLQRATFIM